VISQAIAAHPFSGTGIGAVAKRFVALFFTVHGKYVLSFYVKISRK
jgi:hypothetical protein